MLACGQQEQLSISRWNGGLAVSFGFFL